MVGSIDTLTGLHKLIRLSCQYNNGTTGNVETAFTNINKLVIIANQYVKWTGSSNDWGATTTNINGNIRVFGNKYNLERILLYNRVNINGDLKSLKNLKKLYYVDLVYCDIIGTKTDLYNQGANITHFDV